jgi:hypothetical protein
MTAIGGLGHALPYLISDFWTATTVAATVVLVELGVIAWVRSFISLAFFRRLKAMHIKCMLWVGLKSLRICSFLARRNSPKTSAR